MTGPRIFRSSRDEARRESEPRSRKRRRSPLFARLSAWLSGRPTPSGWVVRPWLGSPPSHPSSLRARGIATFDLELDDKTLTKIEEGGTWGAVSALRRRHPGPLGLVGVGRLAPACVRIAAVPELEVVSLVIAPGTIEVVGTPPKSCATRLIGSPADPRSRHRFDALSDAMGDSADLVFRRSLDDAALEALCLEWFESTLVDPDRIDLRSWLSLAVHRRRHSLRRQVAASMQASAVFVAMTSPPTRAATITVGSECNLRDAIFAAETDTPVAGCPAGNGADTVVLNGGQYSLMSSYGTGLPIITTPITISGNGASLDGEGQLRVFEVEGGELNLVSSKIEGGLDSTGGGIYNNSGAITITDTTISGNTAGIGGGVYNLDGALTIVDSTISGNSADSGGGVYNSGGHVTLTSSTISGNTANHGGGIYNFGAPLRAATVFIQGGSLTGNTVTGVGGAAANVAEDAGVARMILTDLVVRDNRAFIGGAISAESLAAGSVTVNVAGSTVTANTATADGGALALRGDGSESQATVFVTGSALSGNTANSSGGAINAETTFGATVSVTVNHSNLVGNTASDDGGAIRAEALNGATVSVSVAGGAIANNRAGGDGGGLFLSSQNSEGTVSMMAATLSGNTATGQGGGIYSGAGLANGLTITIQGSTLDGNTVGSSGGGIFAVATGDAGVVSRIHNSTISGNTASAGNGGGIRLVSMESASSSLQMDNTALSGNTAFIGGTVDLLGAGQLPANATLNNSIITNSLGGSDCAVAGNASFLGTNNLVDELGGRGQGSACAGIGQEAVTQFDPNLANNGGPTRTHALLPGSNAIDTGAFECAGLIRDQRGARRPLDGDGNQIAVCDIGPVEVGETPVFSDGFESGDTSAWSSTAGTAPGTDDDPHDR